MSEIKRGRLVWSPDRKRRLVIYPTKKGESQPTVFDADQLATSLRGRSEDVIEVDLELPSGKPMRIRLADEDWVATPPSRQPPRPAPAAPPPPNRPRKFHNPYNFVPAPPRETGTEPLGDGPPVGHDSYKKGYVTGKIRVRLTVETPLLIPDAAAANSDQHAHKTFPVRVGADGKPYLPPTSIKGMLRSAYEAVMNSRLAVFEGHEERLAYRMPAPDGLKRIPARVEDHGHGLRVVLYPGDSAINGDGSADGPMYAAWLRCYGRQHARTWGVLGTNGRAVWAYVTLWHHGRFSFWNVVELRDVVAPRPTAPPSPAENRSAWAKGEPANPAQGQWVRGYVCITNWNIDRKHDERVFFSTCPANPHFPLTNELAGQWQALIADYQDEHAVERQRGLSGPPASDADWSRQITGGDDERRLIHKPGKTVRFARS